MTIRLVYWINSTFISIKVELCECVCVCIGVQARVCVCCVQVDGRDNLHNKIRDRWEAKRLTQIHKINLMSNEYIHGCHGRTRTPYTCQNDVCVCVRMDFLFMTVRMMMIYGNLQSLYKFWRAHRPKERERDHKMLHWNITCIVWKCTEMTRVPIP